MSYSLTNDLLMIIMVVIVIILLSRIDRRSAQITALIEANRGFYEITEVRHELAEMARTFQFRHDDSLAVAKASAESLNLIAAHVESEINASLLSDVCERLSLVETAIDKLGTRAIELGENSRQDSEFHTREVVDGLGRIHDAISGLQDALLGPPRLADDDM
jgi:hypothetical protein